MVMHEKHQTICIVDQTWIRPDETSTRDTWRVYLWYLATWGWQQILKSCESKDAFHQIRIVRDVEALSKLISHCSVVIQ